MKIIKKKISPEYFNLVVSGKKKYEFRVADFDVAEGDTLILEEHDPKTREYTGRSLTKKVGYTKKFMVDDFGQRDLILKNGFYIIQLE